MLEKKYTYPETSYPLWKAFELERHVSQRGMIQVTADEIIVQAQDDVFFRALSTSVERLLQIAERIDKL